MKQLNGWVIYTGKLFGKIIGQKLNQTNDIIKPAETTHRSATWRAAKKYRAGTGYDVRSKVLFFGYKPFLAAQTCRDREPKFHSNPFITKKQLYPSRFENEGHPILMKLAPEVGLIEIFQKPGWFCCPTFSSKVTKGSLLGPPHHKKSCFWEGKYGPPWKQTNKALSKIHCMVCFCCKGSFNSCMTIWHRRFWQSGAWHKLWPNF